MSRLLPALVLLVLLPMLGRPIHAQGVTIGRHAGLPSDGITALHATDDTLWIGTLNGLARLQCNGAALQPVDVIELPSPERVEGHVTALLNDGESLLVGTVDGLARWDADDNRWLSWRYGEDGLGDPWITTITLHQGSPVIGSYGGGVQQWDGVRWHPLSDTGPAQITALASNGLSLWAGTPRGLWRWENNVWAMDRDEPVRSLFATSSATLWLGSDNALWQQGADGTWVQRLDEGVTALTETARGVIAATRRGQLFIFTEDEPPIPLGAPSGYVSALAETAAGLAVGTLGDGLWLEAAVTPELPTRLPVVLVPGLGASGPVESSNLRFLAQWLAADGYPVSVAPTDSELSLMENVERLRSHIDEARVQSETEQVWVIAHSWGGVVASTLLSSAPEGVAGLLTLGTPHAGVRLAYNQLVSDLADAAPGALSLLPEHQGLLTPYRRDAVKQRHIGGTRLPEGALFGNYPPHDGLISAASAIAAPGERQLAPLLHGWTIQTMALGAESYLWPDTLYHNTIRPWLQQDRPLAPSPAPPPLDVPPAGNTERLLWEGTLAPDESRQLPVPLTEEATTWFLEGEGIEMSLESPDGRRFSGATPLLGERVAHIPRIEGLAESLGIWGTIGEGGLWQATLSNPSPETQRARLTLVTPSEPALTPILPTWVEPGASFTFWVRARPGQSLSATLLDERTPMVEVAPGIYGARLRAPATPGYHALRVEAGSRQRWAVVTVQRPLPTTLTADPVTDGARAGVRLSGLPGDGPLVVGLELLDADRPVAARWFALPPGSDEDALDLMLPLDGASATAVRWQLFMSDPALVPIGSSQTLTYEMSP